MPPIWNVPSLRNPNFTGRVDLLDALHQALVTAGTAALIQAITGLGGIGKTSLAIEYAYRYSDQYNCIWWIHAEEPTGLATDYARLAGALGLPEKEAQEQAIVVTAVRDWLSHNSGWLLIFDNATDPNALHSYLPQGGSGHTLVTSRNPNWHSLARALLVEVWKRDESVAFLLKRTGQSEEQAQEAEALAAALGDLPLALEQAAAYIAVHCSRFDAYLNDFHKRKLALLEKTRPETGDYKQTVATTWAINFEQVERESKAAAELLRLSAFLAPDRIPEEILIKGASELGPILAAALEDTSDSQLVVDEVLEPLARYSLLHRDADVRTYDIHRLVQEVIKASMGDVERRLWAKRAVVGVVSAYPGSDFMDWPAYERLLPHVLICAEEIARWQVETIEAALMLNQAGYSLHYMGRYREAEPLLQGALTIWEKILRSEHPDMAMSLNNLAELYHSQGRYKEAEPLYQRALAIWEKKGLKHPDLAKSLNNLAGLYRSLSCYEKADPLYKRALAIREVVLGPDHPDVAQSLNNLAGLYDAQGRYEKSEPLYKKALAIWEKTLGPAHPYVATCLNNLGLLYVSLGRYGEAEPLYKKALAVWEKTPGAEHPDMAMILNNLADLYYFLGRYDKAEPLYKRALTIWEKAFGSAHPYIAANLNNLAALYRFQGRCEEAESLYQRALAIRMEALGPEHPDVAQSLNNLAILYYFQGRYREAEPLYKGALAIYKKALGQQHSNVATVLESYADLLEKTDRQQEATALRKRAQSIRAAHARKNTTG